MANAWIFQANPDRFDIDEYLDSEPQEGEWLATRYVNDIQPGDQAFIWRSGRHAGVVAEATVLSPVRHVVDDAPPQFWAKPAEALELRPRVRVAYRNVAKPNEVVKRDWLRSDPILAGHLIFRFPQQTVFRLGDEERERLVQLWNESLDRQADGGGISPAVFSRQIYEAEADRLARGTSLEELLRIWDLRQGARAGKPAVRTARVREFARDPQVGAIARRRAQFRCELPGCAVPQFIGRDGLSYVEVHHIRTLANGGDDTPENVVCLCPVHHREAHLGKDGAALMSALKALRAR